MFNTSVQPTIAEDKATEWWRGASIYQIYPRSFCDSNGDGIGDLPGITSRLAHVASLGVDAVWLSPFFKSPMKDFGYDVSDYRDVDPIFGSLEDFDRLIARARELGLKIIVDQVYSHTSDQHAWFQESRTSQENARADWYIWADAKPDGSPPSNWQSVFGGPAWTWDARRGQYYMHNFLASQPDLNVHNPYVQDALLATMRFWLDRGVDGFRLDALNFCMHDPLLRDNPPAEDDGKRTRPFDFQRHVFNQSHPDIPAFLERFRALADEYEGAFLVAEVGGDEALKEMKLFTEPPNRLQSAYGFLFLTADQLTPQLIAQSVEQWPSDADEGWPSWTFSNHDAPRVVSRWAEGRDPVRFSRMANLLLMSLRGNVFLYQGEELGLPQAEVPFERLQDPEAIANWPQTLGRDGARTPMPWAADRLHAGFSDVEPWLPLDARHRDLSVDVQEADPASTLHFTRRVIALRDRLPVLRTGGVRIVEAGEALLVFERGEGAGSALCVFNLGHEPVEWATPQGWSVQESVNWSGAEGGVLQPLAGAVLTRG